MEYAALALAVIALVLAWIARSSASSLRQAIEDAKSDARRRVETGQEEARAELETLRRIVGRMAAGERLPADMVLEGRLWQEASIADGQRMVAQGNVRILDVRTPQETARGVIPGALLVPVQEIEERWKEIPRDGKTTLVYCAGGQRSAAACEFLSRQGFENLFNLSGGFMSWSGPTAKPD